MNDTQSPQAGSGKVEVTLLDILKLLLSKSYWLLLAGVLAGACGDCVSFMYVPPILIVIFQRAPSWVKMRSAVFTIHCRSSRIDRRAMYSMSYTIFSSGASS